MEEGRIPDDWHEACVLFIYKGKAERSECKNPREMIMLITPGKVLGRVVIERIRGATEWRICEEQCWFR